MRAFSLGSKNILSSLSEFGQITAELPDFKVSKKKEHLSPGSELESLQSTRTLLTDYTELGIASNWLLKNEDLSHFVFWVETGKTQT